jgi:hypothetical protein
MSQPVYTFPHVNSKVKVLVNGQKVSNHPAQSKHSRYINFVGNQILKVTENEETDSFDIDLETFVYDIIAKYMEDKTVKQSPSSKRRQKKS